MAGGLRRPGRPAAHRPPAVLIDKIDNADARLSFRHDRKAFAVIAGRDCVAVRDVEGTREPVWLRGHPSVAHVAVGPDGRWAATAGYKGNGLKIWNAQTGQPVRNLLPGAEAAYVAFSGDGRWLAASATSECLIWQVGSWRLARRLPHLGRGLCGPLAFCPDSRVLAMSSSAYVPELIDPGSGQHLGTIEGTSRWFLSWMCFASDGGRLAVANQRHTIQVWDLRAIRRQLADMGLDWDLPPYVPATDAAPAKPLAVEVALR